MIKHETWMYLSHQVTEWEKYFALLLSEPSC